MDVDGREFQTRYVNSVTPSRRSRVGILPGHFSAKVLPLPAGTQPRYTVYVCQK